MAEETKPLLQSKTFWGQVLGIASAVALAAVTGIADHQGQVVELIKAVTPSWLDASVGPIVGSGLALILSWWGRQDAAQTGKRLKGVF